MKINRKLLVRGMMLVYSLVLLFGCIENLTAYAAPSMARVYIDGPMENLIVGKDNIYVNGWALTPSGIKAVKVYLDDIYIGNAEIGRVREDVNRTYPGYPDGDNSGYELVVDSSKFKSGNHTIKVEAISKDGSATVAVENIKVNAYEGKVYLDSPSNNALVYKGDKLNIEGWALNKYGIKNIGLYIDGKYIADAQIGLLRGDVDRAYPGYPQGVNSGFRYSLDTSNLSFGNHTIEVKVVGNDDKADVIKHIFSVEKRPFRVYIDNPLSNINVYQDDVAINGWALSPSGIKAIKVYLDDVYIGNADIGKVREDVNRTYPGYPDGNNSGYEFIIDNNKFISGNYNIKIEAIGKDGSVAVESKSIKVNAYESKFYIDSPQDNTLVYKGDKLNIEGWALSKYGIKNIGVYIDGKYVADAKMGLMRGDVDRTYPGYPQGVNSGFQYSIDTSDLPRGNHNVEIKVIGKDNKIDIIKRNLIVQNRPARVYMDYPTNNIYVSKNDIAVSGWALSSSGIKEVKIYLDGIYMTNAEIGIERSDVDRTYPGYINGKNSGYNAFIDPSAFKNGNSIIKIEAISNDGTVITSTKNMNVSILDFKTYIDTPKENSSFFSKNNIYIEGWALNTSGIKSVGIYLDDKFIENAQIGIARGDVNKTYPGYLNGDKSGFIYNLDISKLSPGAHKLEIKVLAIDGTEKVEQLKINTYSLVPKTYIESPVDSEKIYNKNINVGGWTIGNTLVNKIEIFINGSFYKNAATNLHRPDVAKAYPEYPYGTNSGFNLEVSKNALREGNNTFIVKVHYKDGLIESYERSFSFSSKPTIMIDPGHGGVDGGTSGVYKNVTYKESTLNLIVANKVKSKLESLGFKVIMTRTKDEALALAQRSVIANEAKVDLFLSIHHDSFDATSNGFSTHYSTYRPGIDTEGIVVRNDIYYDNTPSKPAIESGKLAEVLAKNVSTAVGFRNRGKSDHNLSVTKNTNMTSVLIECGFMSNSTDMAKIVNNDHQNILADSITMTIYNYYK